MRHRRIKYHAEFPGKTFFSYVLLLFLLFISVIPYSLNTALASSNTELAIELKEADRKLNETYRQALSVIGPVASRKLRSSQRVWLAARNDSCKLGKIDNNNPDWQKIVINNSSRARCVINITKFRTRTLYGIYLRQHVDKIGTKSAVVYPDIWHRQIPIANVMQGWFEFYRKKDNDLLIAYLNRNVPITMDKKAWSGIYFFSGKTLEKASKNEILSQGLYQVPLRQEVMLNDGTEIAIMQSSDLQGCPQALRTYFQITYPTKKVSKKTILVYLDNPVKEEINILCFYDSGVVNNRFSSDFLGMIRLPDDTVVAFTRHLGGIVLRFDKKLHSKSPLVGKKFHILEREYVEKLQKEIVIENSIGAKPRIEDAYQRLHDYLMNKLIK